MKSAEWRGHAAMKRQRAWYSRFRIPVLRGSWSALLLLGLQAATAPRAHAVTAEGGTVTNYVQHGNVWTAHVFTNSGTLTFVGDGRIEYLIVGGGGGGGAVWQGGGGGAGGFLTGHTNVTAGALDIVVGAGGKGVSRPGGPSSGGDSSISNAAFGLLVAHGGGHGGGEVTKAAAGGSGGGGSHGHGGLAPGKGVAGQGHDGGSGGYCDAGGGGGCGRTRPAHGRGQSRRPGQTLAFA